MAAKPGQERSAEGGLRGSRDAAAGGPLSLSPAVTSSGHRASTVIIDSGDAGTHNPDGKAWLGTQLHCLYLSFSLFSRIVRAEMLTQVLALSYFSVLRLILLFYSSHPFHSVFVCVHNWPTRPPNPRLFHYLWSPRCHIAHPCECISKQWSSGVSSDSNILHILNSSLDHPNKCYWFVLWCESRSSVRGKSIFVGTEINKNGISCNYFCTKKQKCCHIFTKSWTWFYLPNGRKTHRTHESNKRRTKCVEKLPRHITVPAREEPLTLICKLLRFASN